MATLAPDAVDAIDALLAHAVDTGQVAGLVAAAATGEDVVFAKAYGMRVLGGTAPMTLDTVFRIESMVKAFTSVACLQAVERGLVALDQDLGTILPALAEPLVLESFVDGKPMLRRATSPVTLRRLLTHTAGCGYDLWNERLKAYTVLTGIGREECFGPDHPFPLVSDPGTQWEYGVGMEWAGKMLEALMGQPLDVIFDEAIVAPLGLQSTGYTVRSEMRSRMAVTHQRGADGTLAPYDNTGPDRPKHVLGGGGALSTANDYLRFLQMLLNRGTLDGVTILRPESVDALGSNQIGPLPFVPMRSVEPVYSNDFEPSSDVRTGWGLGFEINLDPIPGRRRAGSFGWAGLRNTYYWVDPRTNLAGLLMTQVLPFGDPAVLTLFQGFEERVYAGSPDMGHAVTTE